MCGRRRLSCACLHLPDRLPWQGSAELHSQPRSVSPVTQKETSAQVTLTHSLTHSRQPRRVAKAQQQCARKHLRARAALAHTQEALAKKVGIVPSLRLCCPSVVTPPGRRWPLLFESLLRYPNQVFYTCRGGYSLDRKLGNATNVNSTKVRLCLPAHWMVISSIGESLRHVQCALQASMQGPQATAVEHVRLGCLQMLVSKVALMGLCTVVSVMAMTADDDLNDGSNDDASVRRKSQLHACAQHVAHI